MSDDPYWAAVEAFMTDPIMTAPAGDHELFDRLRNKAAEGDYEPPHVEVADGAATGPHGPVPLRIYRPSVQRSHGPLLVWCHGGGWLGGDLEMPEADATAREVCHRADAVVVSVGYRLATEGVHFPVPHDDVVAAFRWAVLHAVELGASPGRVTLGGASAGANLAAGAALRTRDEGDPPSRLILIYPLVHPELPELSDELAVTIAGLPPAAIPVAPMVRTLTENYLGAPAGDAGPYAMPGLADLAGLPPTLVVNCEFDGLRASGEAFTEAAIAAGVQVDQRTAPDVLHGHINSPWLPQAQQTYADMAAWVTATPDPRSS